MNTHFFLLHADPQHQVFQDLIKSSEHSLAFYSKNQFFVYSGKQRDSVIFDIYHNQPLNLYPFDETIAKELLLKYRQCLTRWNKHFLSDSTLDTLVVSIKCIYSFFSQSELSWSYIFYGITTSFIHHNIRYILLYGKG